MATEKESQENTGDSGTIVIEVEGFGGMDDGQVAYVPTSIIRSE